MRKLFAVAVIVLFAVESANAGYVSLLKQDFSSSTLAAGLTAWNSPTISGGVASLNGVNQGFTYDAGSYIDTASASATLGPTSSWIMEAVVGNAATAGNVDTLLAFDGEYTLRYRNDSVLKPGSTWSIAGSTENVAVTGPSNGDHVALVYTKSDAAGGTLSYYLNGKLDTSITFASGFYGGSTDAGWGFEVNGLAYHDRGFDGSIKSLAFSTFTGAFSTSDLVLIQTPEPSTILLTISGVLGLLAYAWRKRS